MAFKYIRRFIEDLKKYYEYIVYSTKSSLKAEVSNTLLGYFWWLLDPLLHMLIYTVVVVFIMKKTVPNFPLFVFCGLLTWKWQSSSMLVGADCLKLNSGVLKQIYLPKFIPPMVVVTTNMIKFLFGLIIMLGLVAIYRIVPTWHYIEIIPVIIVNYIYIFALTLLMTHWGALFMDMKNIITHLIRLWFYLSPGFWSINNLPDRYKTLWWWGNPSTAFFESYRNVFMYGKSPCYFYLGYWFVISIVIILIIVRTIYKFDKNYTKVF